ncbi:MAG: CHC2 zinc finger domain-containing protein, partial [Bacteroidales bacterium]|nr:CHC2 zinc finger domain-containing protein [Bacteroidales bacterium]
MIDKLKIQQLRSLPIVGVAKRLNLTVSHKRCLCPFHDDQRPSLYLNKNLYHCFVCEAHGDPISLVQKVRHLTFTDACHWLDGSGTLTAENTQLSTVNSQLSTERRTEFNASRYSRFFEHPFLSVPAQDFLFRERHLSPQVIQYCRLNSYRDSHGTHWLQIPYYDLHGHLIGVQSRYLDYKKD